MGGTASSSLNKPETYTQTAWRSGTTFGHPSAYAG